MVAIDKLEDGRFIVLRNNKELMFEADNEAACKEWIASYEEYNRDLLQRMRNKPFRIN